MILTNRKVRVVFIIIVIVSILQLVRLGYLVQWNKLANDYGEVYSLSEAKSLQDEDLIGFSKVTCLYIPSSEEEINENYLQLFQYLKLDVKVLNPNIEITSKELQAFDLVVIGEDKISLIESFEAIITYVKEGGSLVIAGQFDLLDDTLFSYYSRDFGVIEWGDFESYKGYTMTDDFILGGDVTLTSIKDERLTMTSTRVSLVNQANVHMLSSNNNPVVWDIGLGAGKVAIMNMHMPDLEIRRSMMLGCIDLVSDVFVYPIINAEIVFIDDFPGKFSGNSDKVQEEYGRSIERFLSEIWWPDMVSTIKNYGIKYSCAFITNYDNKVSGDFDQIQLIDKSVLLSYGREIFKYGGEITYHGYNHQPLIYDQKLADNYGYKAWANDGNMQGAIATARDYFNNIFPEYKFVTYVPPSNLFDEKALTSLKGEIPTLQAYSGVILSEEEGVLSQEFLVMDNGMVALPRISAGSIVNQVQQLSVDSLVSVNGIVNHFIHPDDFMDAERSHGRTWEELFKSYDEFLSRIDSKYPWLEKTTASRGAQKLKQYHYADIYTKVDENRITIACDNFATEQSLIMFIDQDVNNIEGGSIEKIGEHHYLIIMEQNLVTVGVD